MGHPVYNPFKKSHTVTFFSQGVFFNFPPPINLSGILLRDWDLAKFRGKVNENTLYKPWDLAKVREDKLKKKTTLYYPLPSPQVDNRPHLSPDFMESVMELLAQAQAVYAARGTKEYPAMLALLPEGYRDNYHQIIQKGAQYVVTLFLAQRAVESIKVMDVTDLVKEEDDTLEFSYWREVSIWPQMMMLTFEVDLITNSAIISGGTAG